MRMGLPNQGSHPSFIPSPFNKISRILKYRYMKVGLCLVNKIGVQEKRFFLFHVPYWSKQIAADVVLSLTIPNHPPNMIANGEYPSNFSIPVRDTYI
jgi:hypothetical protein